MHVTAIIAAGGQGRRFGGAQRKQLVTIHGRAVLDLSVSAFASHPAIADIVVALPAELVENPPAYLRNPPTSGAPIRIVAGGARRQDSVANAFRAAGDGVDLFVIHDAARPFVSADLISRAIEAAAESGAAVAALQAQDTVKRAADATRLQGGPYVQETLARDAIFLAQTPQAFTRAILADALARGGGGDATDEALLAERAGHRVRIVSGERSNIKITTPEDLLMAEAIARGGARRARTGRMGTGYDLHRLVRARPLMIGGVRVPSELGALGHSDGDVACHAITDAILGAAALGDIGQHFPDSEPRWKGAAGLDLLRRAAAVVAANGFEIGNVDVTIILEAPKIRGHVDAMRAAVADAIGIDTSRVSIKGKTNEGVDAVGRGEAIAAHAIAVIRDAR
jgi:2-C-methyl-D-erythritol 4-phosphate cytidylyltransferase / 2-C-methyl-D-erythritol 2,4-cyclodiphosphate synthase